MAREAPLEHRVTVAQLLDQWPLVVPAYACLLLGAVIQFRLVRRIRREGRRPSLGQLWQTAKPELIAINAAVIAFGVLMYLATSRA